MRRRLQLTPAQVGSLFHVRGVELFLTSSVPPGDEFCTLLVARDQLGQEKRVSVAINTGGPRRECVIFDTDGLSSSTYHGPHRGSIGPWFNIGEFL
ncbi:hypothetical protein ANCCAN_22792 [Ancylostoma caninum]|uniref:Uncharacterized protein n=1 Tax=Ancylostoma caninum TaxID=29170 RepID=A0A368FGQ8_ANCCA|nr:hypothetical protein ANCCAN_22792 [Ancylostoma caninum]